MYGKNKKLRRASKCRMLLFFQILAMTFFPMYFGKAGDFRTQFGNNSVIYNAEAPQGGTAKFPCDITSSGAGERLSLVMWYKQGRVSPIYSYDVRNVKMLGKGVHWLDKEVLGERAHFRPNGRPAAQLVVEQVQSNDAGLYRCRADYNKIPTRNHFVNFTVIVPVEKVAILDRDGKHIRNYKLGPFNEGESISISCVATGGEPPPLVSWWLENTLLNNVSTLILSNRRVENSLRLDPLRRSHLNRVFTCRASNSALIPPISSAVKLLINLRPLWVKLRGENRPLSAGHSYELECEVVGAIPPPTVTWWKGSAPVTTSKTVTTGDGNTTISILHFIPSIEDGGKYLSCRGEQPFITESGLEDGWKLDIHHIPIVTLELGSTVNSTVIKEGADVYFECNIKSNPWIYQIRWMHNTKQLYNNVAEGILVSNQSLVLQGVTRASSGVYTCVASNREGDGESNPVQLDVKFAPICRPGQVQSFGVGRGEIAKIPCELEGNPAKINFTWIFNTTESSGEIPPTKILVEPLRSIAQYKPETESDFGTLSCWGQNDVGLQTAPCVFRLMAAGKPDVLVNCTASNQTENSFLVECTEGYDGGLPQEFMIDVYTSNQKLITTVASKQPKFLVVGLDSGKSYDVVAAGLNNKGRGPPFVIQTQTLRSVTKYRGYLPTVEDLRESPGALIAVSIVVLICVGIMATCIYEKITWMSKSEEREMEVRESHRTPAHLQQSSSNTSDEHNPDVIPQGGDGDEFSEEERAFDYLKTAPPRMYTVPPRTPLSNLQSTTFACDTNEKVTYSELIHAPQMAERMTGATLPRPKGPLIYAQLDVSRASQQNVYATMDCRTTKTGIVESNTAVPLAAAPAGYTSQPAAYGPAGMTRLGTLPRTRLDSTEMTHTMMPMQPLGDCRYPQVPQTTEMNRF